MKVWDGIKYVFPIRKLGSKILLTTMIWEVTLHVDRHSHPHQLRSLNRDKSYVLLMNKAFPETSVLSSEFQNLAKEILVKCKGLLLVVFVVSGSLSRKLQNISGGLLENQEKITTILTLSYNPFFFLQCSFC